MIAHPYIRVSCLGSALAALALVSCSSAPTPVPEPSVSSVEKNVPGHVERQDLVTVSAVVDAIDQKTREITLRRSDDSTTTFRVDDAVRNLPQVKKGDLVELTYYRSTTVDVHKPGEATPGVSAAAASDRAALGEMPAAVSGQSVTLVATIRALDRAKGTATLEDTEGNLTTIDVRNPEHFDVAKIGDLVEITYTEAVAISVEKPQK